MLDQAPVHRAADAAAITTLLSAVVGWLPTIAVLLPIVYYAMLIGEKLYRWYQHFKTKPPETGPGGAVQ